MRPRKRVLLIANSCSLEEQYTLILQTWGLATVTERQHVERTYDMSAVVTVALPMHQLPVLISEHYPVPVVAFVGREIDRQIAARMGAHHTAADHYVLREQVRIAVARKRGPKKEVASDTAPSSVMERAA